MVALQCTVVMAVKDVLYSVAATTVDVSPVAGLCLGQTRESEAGGQWFLGDTLGWQRRTDLCKYSSSIFLRTPCEGIRVREVERGWTVPITFLVNGVCHHSCHLKEEIPFHPESCPENVGTVISHYHHLKIPCGYGSNIFHIFADTTWLQLGLGHRLFWLYRLSPFWRCDILLHTLGSICSCCFGGAHSACKQSPHFLGSE